MMGQVLPFPAPEPVDDETESLISALERGWIRERKIQLFLTGMAVGTYTGLWLFVIIALIRWCVR